jgi:Rod binding domain-containing protein
MSALAAPAVPLNLLKPAASAPAAAQTATQNATLGAKRAAIHKTAQAFETQFLSQMLGSMFEGVDVSPPFGGGQGEQAFRSFLMDAFAKQMTKAGGIGLTNVVQREMLKMQGLS